MVYIFPLNVEIFMDVLKTERITPFHVERYDEYSGIGTGQDIQAELAGPKWTTTFEMRPMYHAEARQIAAIVRKLHGSQHAVMIYDPSAKYPANDPKGTVLGAANVQLNSIGANNQSLSLKGLPPGYKLTFGDRGQLSFGTEGNYYFEVSEAVQANGAGVTPVFEVFPHVPLSALVNTVVKLRKPACKMTIKAPDGFNPGKASGNMTEGITIDFLEKV